MSERSDVRPRFRASRSFYLGFPFFAVILGICGSVIAVVSISPSDRVFFPQYPAGQSDAIALIAFGCAAAGFAALLLMPLSKFVLRLNNRASIIFACFAAWGGWASYILANADFGDRG